jgi:hypothetical protein
MTVRDIQALVYHNLRRHKILKTCQMLAGFQVYYSKAL